MTFLENDINETEKFRIFVTTVIRECEQDILLYRLFREQTTNPQTLQLLNDLIEHLGKTQVIYSSLLETGDYSDTVQEQLDAINRRGEELAVRAKELCDLFGSEANWK